MSAAVRGNPGAKRGTLAPSDSHAKRRRNEEDEDDAYLDDDDDGGGAAGGMDEEDFDMMEQVEAEIALEMDEGQEAPPDEDDAAGAEAEVESDEAEVDYRRPPLKPFDRKTQSIAFQWVDIDTTSGPRLQVDPKTGRAPAIDSKEDITPHIRLYGVTEEGHSIFAHVHGFLPYFYIPCPSSFNSVAHCTALKDSLTRALRSKERGDETRLKDPCLGIGFKMDQSTLLGYTFNRKATFLRVVMAMPSLVTKAKNILTDGLHVQGFGPFSISSTYESNVPFVLRFMVDKEIQGANWLELPAGSYSVREAHKKKSRCQLEVDIYYEHIISHQPEGEWSKIAPLRILSFDIECAGRKGIFPEADKDPVIQIANTVSIQGQSELLVKNVFTLDGCSAIPGAKVVSSSEEVDLLCKWSEFVRVADPDIITGYNIQNFDVPYLLGRGKALGKFSAANAKTLSTYFEWGRLRGANCVMRDTTFQSSAYGKRENVETTIHGRVMFDMLPYMFRNHKLSSYSLNSVSAEYLGQQKEDVHYSVISDLQRGSDDDRRRLAVYCIKDAHLPLLLMEKLSVMVNYIEMARVTGVPLNFLLTRGQQIKVSRIPRGRSLPRTPHGGAQ
jgi:DNA polymerase delta subunit 1